MTDDDKARILIVDDERVIQEILADFLAIEGFAVETASNGEEALTALSRHRFDLVLSDLKMPRLGGLEVLDHVKQHMPEVVTIIMTGFGTVETAISAMKHGAYDYILKPFKIEHVVHTVRRGLDHQRLHAENLRLKEALSLYKVSEAIASSLSLDAVMETIVETALQEIRCDVISVLLANGEGGYYERVHEVSERYGATFAGEIDASALDEWQASGRPILVHGKAALEFYKRHPEGAAIESLAATRMRMRDRVLGYIITVSFTRDHRFVEGQRKLLQIVANRAAAAIENAHLYEDLQATFHQTIRGLASAIDKMDRYTSGHSERVARYAQHLARKLGLDEDTVELVRQSALLHDIGKIGCVLNLNKPGQLSQPEYEVFRKHPGYGREILDPITFLHPLLPGVHLHHERWDGLGYPLGLKGTNIPLIARIISVADTYDAMTSDRAYRKALPHAVTMSEIKRCSGTQFDPDVANPFTEGIEELRKERGEKGEPIPP